MAMVKKNINLTSFQIKRISEETEYTGLKMSEIFRRALDEYLDRKDNERYAKK